MTFLLASNAAWLPLASAVVGGVLALLGGLLAPWVASKHQRRQQKLDFQERALLDLQADLLQIYRGFERGEDYTQAWRRSTILVVRVADDDVRSFVEFFKRSIVNQDRSGIANDFENANQRIGEVLRRL